MNKKVFQKYKDHKRNRFNKSKQKINNTYLEGYYNTNLRTMLVRLIQNT